MKSFFYSLLILLCVSCIMSIPIIGNTQGNNRGRNDNSNPHSFWNRWHSGNQRHRSRQSLVADNWYIAGQDRAYKLTESTGTWEEAKRACKAMEADLAVYGIRDATLRWKVGRGVWQGPVWIGLWVGLTDHGVDGQWKWIDGQLAKSDEIQWSPREPNGKSNENCGEMWGEERSFTMNDLVCDSPRRGLCERKIQ